MAKVMSRQVQRPCLLENHRNYNEYWVCATCGRPRRKNTPRRKPCKRCRCSLPPRLRITRYRGDQERAHNDSEVSRVLVEAAVMARAGLGLNKGSFPPRAPSREFLRDVFKRFPEDTKGLWFCQVFIDGARQVGFFPRCICFHRVAEEAMQQMSDKKMMQIRIPADLHKWLKLHAAKEDSTMTEIILNYLRGLRRRSENSVKVDQI